MTDSEDKYYPERISDLIINPSKINNFIYWLDNFYINANKYRNQKRKIKVALNIEKIELNDNGDITEELNISNKKNNSYDKNTLIVTGGHGIGKTTFVKTILQEKNYNITSINLEKINKIKDINEYIEKLLKGVNIFMLINNNQTSKRVIVIDNIDIISSTSEKLFITQLIKLNQIGWYLPIIFISNNKHNKIINLIKKTSYEIELFCPTVQDINLLLYKIAEKENIKFTDESVCIKIIINSNKDIRTLINHIISLSSIYKNKIIDNNIVDEYFITNKEKDHDLGIFDASKKLFYENQNIDDIIRIFETEKTIIPLMIQHHYIKYLKQKNFNKIKEISQSLSKGDLIENYIYEHNVYDIRDTQAYFQCIFPSYQLTKTLNPQKISIEKYNSYFSFPLDLNKTSIKHINYSKNIIPSNKYFKNMNINDYINLDKIIKGLIKVGDYEELNNLIDKYKLNISAIESVLKINKLNGEKFVIPNKIKKLIIKNCPNIIDIDKE
jgi:hypothetical protein